MKPTDLPMVLKWRNHPDVRRYMVTQHEIGQSEHEAWFAEATQDTSRRLLIAEESGNPLGYVQFSNVAADRAASWGFYSYPGAARGTGRKLGIVALDYAFSELRLHKVCGEALEFNVNSIAFHRRLGFVQEGVLREQHNIDGAYHHLVCFGLLRQEWLRARSSEENHVRF